MNDIKKYVPHQWFSNDCDTCNVATEVLFHFRHPYPIGGWKFCDVYYLQCPKCDRLYIGEYSEGKVSGKCWSRNPIYKVHQLEGFIGEAYWAYHTEPVVEIDEDCI